MLHLANAVLGQKKSALRKGRRQMAGYDSPRRRSQFIPVVFNLRAAHAPLQPQSGYV